MRAVHDVCCANHTMFSCSISQIYTMPYHTNAHRHAFIYMHTNSHTHNPFSCTQNPSQVSSLEQYAMRSYSDALDSIPMALADNAGLSPIYCLSQVKSRQIAEKNPRLGIDCMQKGNSGKLQVTELSFYFASVVQQTVQPGVSSTQGVSGDWN